MKRILRYIIFLSLNFLSNAHCIDPDLTEKIIKSESRVLGLVPAQLDAQKKAVQELSEPLIKSLLSNEQYQKQKKRINQFILSSWSKYISQVKVISTKKKADRIDFEFKLSYSLRTLKDLLIEKNFLAETDQFLKILPLIQWIDEKNQISFQWWRHSLTKEKLDLHNKSSEAYEVMKTAFFEQGLLLSNPIDQKIFDLLPDPLKIDQYSEKDLLYLSQFTKHQLLLIGSVRLLPTVEKEKTGTLVQIDVYNPVTKKKLLTFEKKTLDKSSWFESKDTFRDLLEELKVSSPELATQIYENWQRGTINSQAYKLEILGQFTIDDQSQIKNLIQTKIPEIRLIKDRSFSLKQLSFEVETQLTSSSLSEKMIKIKELRLKQDPSSAISEGLRFIREPLNE